MATANQIQYEVDVLDVMRKLRQALSDLDSCNYLSNKIKTLNDQTINELIDQAVVKVAEATAAVNSVIKNTESNATYKELVRRYRNPQSGGT